MEKLSEGFFENKPVHKIINEINFCLNLDLLVLYRHIGLTKYYIGRFFFNKFFYQFAFLYRAVFFRVEKTVSATKQQIL